MTTVGDVLYHMGGVPVGTGNKMITGSVYFVDSSTGNSGNTGKKPSTALDTLANALDKCTANKGDVIYIMPGHTETTGTTAPRG